ncbi:MAG: 2,3-bisphosphoglycerate-independent phosphoglycerate mutase, partial [Candidatus Methanomethylophilaceae archaeon]|nr:2,3-bisphosphoglycerate-independent phosphoglycerate mutase [Candidatus Methanomethylophilaceae archaeon]
LFLSADPIGPGIRPGSDTAHLSILGYDPYETYTGRGPLEALGLDMDLAPGDVAIRCNFASMDDDGRITDRRAGRIDGEEAEELIASLNGIVIDDVQCTVRKGTGHRAVLVLHGEGLHPDITDCDPGSGDILEESVPLNRESSKTASVVNRFVRICRERFRDHRVNRERSAKGLPRADVLVPRGAGMAPEIEPFGIKWGISAACVSGVGLVRGVCKACGMKVWDLPPECNGGLDSDFKAKADCAMAALSEFDFVLMNCKAADVAGHDMNPKLKCDVIKRLDAMAGHLRKNLGEDTVVVFTCDHCTPCSLGDHSGDPVPVTIYSTGAVRDWTKEFSESGCSGGFVGRIRSRDLVPICMDLANRTRKFGS